jgi:hypothetical protein
VETSPVFRGWRIPTFAVIGPATDEDSSRACVRPFQNRLANPHEAAGQTGNKIAGDPWRRDSRAEDFVSTVNADEVE